MNDTVHTNRLLLSKLNTGDAEFMFRLVNTPGWIQNIGDRNIHNINDALTYINKVSAIDNYHFWTAKLDNTPIGLVTFLKKEYLPCPDIGFAFLPEFSGNGYAYEAADAIMDLVINKYNINSISAVTIKENTRSMRLLEKLDLVLQGNITIENEELLLFYYLKPIKDKACTQIVP